MRDRRALVPAFFLLLLIVLGWMAYAPGLHGGFLFDDFGNLPALGASGPVDNWPTFWRYITSSTADPTGRPLTLLSFLLDAHDWPADPYPFKRTSLILHLLNGVLLYALLARLGNLLSTDTRASRIAALAGTALWLLHPLLVSTTLYIVQREAILPATCVLTGLLIWLHGRSQLAIGRIASGLFWGIVGLGGCTVLGTLAKANGALLPLYALVIEVVLLARRQLLPAGKTCDIYRAFLLTFVVLPTAFICAHVIWVGVHGILTGGPKFRPWSIGQRLLTEPRVLMDYLSLLWSPRPFSSGLFNDQYVVSTSLLHPLTTLPSIAAVTMLIGGAWWARRSHPALSAATLFYFAGHLIESTSLPLELYFEHRNYVPALLMFWPLGLWLANMTSLRTLKCGLMMMLPLGLALMTHARAAVWGNVHTQALLWAQINPDSARAQANAAQIEMQTGHPLEASRRLEARLAAQPDQVQLAFNLIGARCMTGGVQPADIAIARKAMRESPNPGSLFAHWFDRILPIAVSGECPGLRSTDLLDLINAGLQNPRLSGAGPQQDLIFVRGRIALAQHRPEAALDDFLRAMDLQVRPGIALQAAAALGTAGYPTQGLRVLDHYQEFRSEAIRPPFGMPMLHEWVLVRQGYWPQELAHLRRELARDANLPTPALKHPLRTGIH